MYSNILVTLDGSELAENALPHMATVYRGCTAKPNVTILMVSEPVEKPYGTTTAAVSPDTIKQVEQLEKERTERKLKYLESISDRLNKINIPVAIKLLAGKPAETIVDYIARNKCDLLVMSTHGRSGISRWVMGSVADKVLRHAGIPIMMIRAPKCGPLFLEGE